MLPQLHRSAPTPAARDAPSPPLGVLQRPGWKRSSRSAGGFPQSAAGRPERMPSPSSSLFVSLSPPALSHSELIPASLLCSSAFTCSSMPHVLTCLRRFFIGFNIFFTIGTGLAIAVSLALLSPSADDMRDANKFEGRTTNRIVLYVWGSVSMAIAILGAFGAHKRNLVALTVFLVCVVIGSLLTLQAGVLAAAARPKLESLMEERWRSFLPLDQASEDVKNQVEALQTSLRCCGLFSYEDWEQNIPASCLCDQQGELEGKCQSVDYKNLLWNVFWQKKCVFRQTCFPLIMVSAVKDADVTLGVVFALFVMAMLGSVLSAMMIQMFNAPPAVPLTFVDRPPAYQQLYNLPE